MARKTRFTAAQFVATKWEPASQKARFANQFCKFLLGGCRFNDFPKWFYQRLSMTFGNIAHYNQHTFYATFFVTAAQRLRFIELTVNHPCYGDPTYTYSDVERALIEWIRDSGIAVEFEAERNRPLIF